MKYLGIEPAVMRGYTLTGWDTERAYEFRRYHVVL